MDDCGNASYAMYQKGCRCEACKEAKRAYRRELDIRKRMGMVKTPASKVLYAAYRGDEFIDVGTALELSKTLGISEYTVRLKASPSQKERSDACGGLLITRLEDDDG